MCTNEFSVDILQAKLSMGLGKDSTKICSVNLPEIQQLANSDEETAAR